MPRHLFQLHTGVVTWTTLKVTIVEFKIATLGRTDAVDSGMCMRLLQPDERHEKALLLNTKKKKIPATISIVNLRTNRGDVAARVHRNRNKNGRRWANATATGRHSLAKSWQHEFKRHLKV